MLSAAFFSASLRREWGMDDRDYYLGLGFRGLGFLP